MSSATIQFPQFDQQPQQPAQTPAPQPAPEADTQHAQHGFFSALKNVAMGAMPGVQRYVQQQHENKRQEEQDLRANQQKDLELAQFHEAIGSRPVVHGMVRDDLPLSDGMTVLPGALIRKAGEGGRQIVNHKTAEGEKIQWELPTPEERINLEAARHAQQFQAELPTLTGKANLAGVEEFNKALNKSKGENVASSQDPNKVPLSSDVTSNLGIPSGTKVLPTQAATMAGEAASTTGKKVESNTKVLNAGWEALRSVQNQDDYNQWLKDHPANAVEPGVGKMFSPTVAKTLTRRLVPEKEAPEYDIKAAERDAMTASTPEADEAIVEKIAPAATNPELHRSTVALLGNARSTGLPAAAKAAILKDASDKIADIAKEKDPGVMQAKIRMEVAKQQALNQLAPSALAHVDPKFYTQATAAYMKSGEDLAKAQSAADDVQTVLNLAEQGNKAAGANAPMIGVAAANAINGIKRINSAEIAQYGTAGSLLDKIQGRIQGLAVGQPIPKDVLEDMKEFHRQISLGAQAKHDRERQAINKTFNADFPPMTFAQAAQTTSGPAPASIPANVQKALAGAKPGLHTLSDGSKWTLGADGSITSGGK